MSGCQGCQGPVWNINTTTIAFYRSFSCYIPGLYFMTRISRAILRICTRTLPVYTPSSHISRRANFSSTVLTISSSEDSKGSSMPSAFTRLSSTTGDGSSKARLGELAFAGKDAIETPNFLAVTSRGVMPHISPDAIPSQVSFPGVFIAIEDCSSLLSSRVFASPFMSRASPLHGPNSSQSSKRQ